MEHKSDDDDDDDDDYYPNMSKQNGKFSDQKSEISTFTYKYLKKHFYFFEWFVINYMSILTLF